MTDGEAPERIWAVLNSLACRTREMAVGHRHDIINDHHSDMNVRRTHDMGAIDEEVERLESNVPEKTLKKWKHREAEYLRKVVNLSMHEGLDNPYEVPKEKAPSQKQVSARLNKESSGTPRTERRGLIGVLEEGIDLEELRLEIREELKVEADEDEPNDSVKAKLERFYSRLEVWQTLRDIFLRLLLVTAWADVHGDAKTSGNEDETSLEAIVSTVHAKMDTGATCGEHADALASVHIDLPSTLEPQSMHAKCLKDVIDMERRLREGQANDALAEVRLHLITKFCLKKQQREISGQVPMTRSRQHVKRQGEAIERSADKYRRARACVLTLLETAGDCTLRELKAEDLVAFTMRDEDHVLGESRKSASSWIWEDISWLENTEDRAAKVFVTDAVRVHWFRRSALKARWTEQLLLVQEEMRRTLRFFQHWEQWWIQRSIEQEAKGNKGHAGYGRRQAARYKRLLDDAKERFQERIDVCEALNHSEGLIG